MSKELNKYIETISENVEEGSYLFYVKGNRAGAPIIAKTEEEAIIKFKEEFCFPDIVVESCEKRGKVVAIYNDIIFKTDGE